MSKEARFINYFLLQHESDPTRFVIYETWLGTAEDFLKVEMPRAYRQEYEKAVPGVLAKPREIERDWKLVYAADRGSRFVDVERAVVPKGEAAKFTEIARLSLIPSVRLTTPATFCYHFRLFISNFAVLIVRHEFA
jgi:tRNA(Ile2) C34 agmatinyltransferase TiaS